MTDAEFARILPYLPSQPPRGRKRETDLRAVVDAIFYLLQSGCQWAMLPKDFPFKRTVYWYFKRFQKVGTWERIHGALYLTCRDLEDRKRQPSAVIIDSQSVKTGPNACDSVTVTMPAIRPKGASAISSPTPWAFCSRPMSIPPASRIATARPGSSTKLTACFRVLDVIIGDGGYAGPIVRRATPRRVKIVKRSDRAKGFEVLPKRCIVEGTFAWLTINRRLARDVEPFADPAKTYIQIAMIELVSRRLARYCHC